MIEGLNPKYSKGVITVFPGEYHAQSAPGVITTLLGSCVSVVMYDPYAKVGGMNHFMLSEVVNPEKFFLSSAGKYGMYAMELLINKLMQIGANKYNLQAKVFGGSSMFGDPLKSEGTIPDNNTQLAFKFLDYENIPVVSSDVGGDQARRLYFVLDTFKVYVRKVKRNSSDIAKSEERKYFEKLKADRMLKSNQITIYK